MCKSGHALPPNQANEPSVAGEWYMHSADVPEGSRMVRGFEPESSRDSHSESEAGWAYGRLDGDGVPGTSAVGRDAGCWASLNPRPFYEERRVTVGVAATKLGTPITMLLRRVRRSGTQRCRGLTTSPAIVVAGILRRRGARGGAPAGHQQGAGSGF